MVASLFEGASIGPLFDVAIAVDPRYDIINTIYFA